MNLLTMEHLTKFYTERMLFQDAGFSINEGEKIGVIGINGTGKTTLLRIAAGLEEPDEGTVTMGNGLAVRYLAQNPYFEEGSTVLSCVMKGNSTPHNKWTLESEAKAMLTRLGIYEFGTEIEKLSGGQKKRVALASVLLSEADILILDEPTNHLDSSMAEWLEDYLNRFKGALLMVTHDRYFLDSVTNRIVEIDKGRIYSYQTNYLGFLELKAEREAIEQASERKRQSLLRTEIAWMQRGARARSTKQKAHIQRVEDLKERQAPVQDGRVEMESVSSRMGRTTVELEGLCKSYGEKKLVEDFSYIFLKNDRIGIIGPNGCGKSTLMKMIVGAAKPDSGEVVIGQTIKTGYFSQENEYMDESLKVIDYVREGAEIIRTPSGTVTASQMLERFLFPSNMHYTVIGRLSGGEKRRLYLLRVLMEAPNVLILDEPTNDLDIETLTILEDYLDGFDGIVIAVSHDRYFLDRVARRIFAFEGGGKITRYEGGYTDYRQEAQIRQSEKPQEDKGAALRPKPKQDRTERLKKLKFTYQEQRDYDTIEEVIASIEERISGLQQEIEASAHDYGKLNVLMTDKEQAEGELEEKMERWMYLNDLAEKIAAQSGQ